MRRISGGIFVAETHLQALDFACSRAYDPSQTKRTINLINEHWDGARALISRFAATMAGIRDEEGHMVSVKVIEAATNHYVTPYGRWGPYADRHHLRKLVTSLMQYEDLWQSARVEIEGNEYTHDEFLYDFLVRNGLDEAAIEKLEYQTNEADEDACLATMILPRQWYDCHADWLIGEHGKIYED